MSKYRCQQINKMTIHWVPDAPAERRYSVSAPDGRVLEEFAELADAVGFCNKTLDFTKREKAVA